MRSHRRIMLIGFVAGALLLAWPAVATADTATFDTVGSAAFPVPANVCSITVDALGAVGGPSSDDGNGDPEGSVGGSGGHVQATLAVTPNEVLTINVGGAGDPGLGNDQSNGTVAGGAGGFGGGGAGGNGTGGIGARSGGGGGGASDVSRGTTRLVVAGGGGGAGGWSGFGGESGRGTPGGAGGGTSGGVPDGDGDSGAFTAPPNNEGGLGGQAGAAGGAGGIDSSLSTSGDGADGTNSGTGGAGGANATVTDFNGGGGGGGGGGVGGGGGGAVQGTQSGTGGAGGGGSNFVDPAATGVVDEAGVNADDGAVVITFTPDPVNCASPAALIARFTG